MLTYILVNKICNLAKKMKLWNSPQRLQEEVEYRKRQIKQCIEK